MGDLLLIIIALVITGNNSDGAGDLTYSLTDLNELKYSQKQELDADNYANKYIIKKYGTNKSAIAFFKEIDKEQKLPEFVHYFSTHPSPTNRIKNLK